MRLKRLVLQGYKTFASKTEFIFDEGLTAIVGPNGSGKSNIADALRWVLGEQSYSTLRGRRTVDMIFAGSQTRPRAGMTQVILTLDNSDGWLPIDYTEVEIGRRAFRSGENEYILNGQKVRLKDVTELLATSGLSERTYTIIGQGLVDQALSLRAEERRALFEEAAGINHYKARRAETLRRLEETQRNLQRVYDILAEIGPRLTSLKRQATRTRNYHQLATDLRHLLRTWHGYQWEQAKVRLRQARQTAVATETTWQQNRQALLKQQEKIDDLRRRTNHLQQEAAEKQVERETLREQLEKARRDVAILAERQESTRRQLAEIEQDLPLVTQQQAAATTELAAATTELATAQMAFQENQALLQQFNSTFQAQQAEISRRQQTLRQAEEQRRTTLTRLAQVEGQLAQLQERLKERESDGGEQTTAELERLEALQQRQTAALESAQAAASQLRQKREVAASERQALAGRLKQLRRDFNEQEQALNRRRQEVARLEARVDLLDQMRLKEASPNGNVNVVGRLASLITIPMEHQIALEAALSARLGMVLVPDAANLWQLISQAEARQTLVTAALDRLVPPQPADTPAHAAVIGWAGHLVQCGDNVRPLVELLLGRVLLVGDPSAAYEVALTLPPGALAVAPDGFMAHAGGVVELNGLSAGAAANLLAHEAEWRKSRDELEEVRQALTEVETGVAKAQALIQQKQNEVDALQNEERRLARLEQEANQRLGQAQRHLDQARQQQSFLMRQQEAQAQEVTRLRARIQEVEQSLLGYRQAAAELETVVHSARAALEDLPVAEAQQQRQTLRQQIETAQTIVAGRQAVVDSRRATLNQIDRQLGRLQERRRSLQRQQEQLALAYEESQQQQLQQQVDNLEAGLTPLRQQLGEARQALAQLEEETAAIQKQAHEHETVYTQARIALAQQKHEIEGLQERIKADLGLVALSYDDDQTGPTPLPMSEVVEQLPTVKELPADLEETILNYRGQMQRMGAINPDAPAEYEEVQARHDFLTQQVEDLGQTDGRLRRVISELDELTSRAFAETVAKVNDVFGDTFTQLFGGGAARLVLTEPDDLTVSGVDIIARLPNRREQGLGLLSGGERSLTAVALIFSLLKVSPTPFCVMDEVDAALDEANINRFRELLRELSLKTQFIIITHNRGTVQVAHTIYGISMGSDSASQAISIRPEEYVKREA